MSRAVFGFGLGALVGYFLGALLGCEIMIPASNLCGLGGALVGLPLGGVVGASVARRRPPDSGPGGSDT